MTPEEADVQRAFELGRRMRRAEQQKGADRRRRLDPRRAVKNSARKAKRRALLKQTPEGRESLRLKTRAALLMHQYGLTLEQFENMKAQQGGACASCGDALHGEPNTATSAHVDHCHASGRVRGILCHRCNVAVGMLLDSPTRALKVAAYLDGACSAATPGA